MNNLKTSMNQWLVQALTTKLPTRTKRLIFLASFTAMVENTTSLSSQAVSKLNHLMALATNEAAIQLPVRLSAAIWNGKRLEDFCGGCCHSLECMSYEQRGEVCRRISEMAPKWLHYGAEDDIVHDIARILDHRQQLLAA